MILAEGDTKEAALDSLSEGVLGHVKHLKSKGQTLPAYTVELANMEVAA